MAGEHKRTKMEQRLGLGGAGTAKRGGIVSFLDPRDVAHSGNSPTAFQFLESELERELESTRNQSRTANSKKEEALTGTAGAEDLRRSAQQSPSPDPAPRSLSPDGNLVDADPNAGVSDQVQRNNRVTDFQRNNRVTDFERNNRGTKSSGATIADPRQ